MEITHKTIDGIEVALVQSDTLVLASPGDVLDLIGRAGHRMALPKSCVAEEFFDLRTGFAGEALQKFINYQAKVAFVGDFSQYTSKALRDFIYESNNGHDIFFVSTAEEAMERLANAS